MPFTIMKDIAMIACKLTIVLVLGLDNHISFEYRLKKYTLKADGAAERSVLEATLKIFAENLKILELKARILD